jgi:hypothetical protein
MKKTYILSGVIIILIISLIFLIFDVLSLKSDLYSFSNLKTENVLLKEVFFHSYDYEGIEINFSQKIFDSNLQEITFIDIIKNENTLVLFINVSACDRCTYDNIKRIKDIKHKSKLNIFIGISGLDKRQFNSFVHNNKISDDSYLIPDNIFSGFRINPVVYFVIDSSHNLKYFYAPNDIFPTLTDDYFSKINNLCDKD